MHSDGVGSTNEALAVWHVLLYCSEELNISREMAKDKGHASRYSGQSTRYQQPRVDIEAIGEFDSTSRTNMLSIVVVIFPRSLLGQDCQIRELLSINCGWSLPTRTSDRGANIHSMPLFLLLLCYKLAAHRGRFVDRGYLKYLSFLASFQEVFCCLPQLVMSTPGVFLYLEQLRK